jgi:hypothetical protein
VADYGVPDETVDMDVTPDLALTWMCELDNACRPPDQAIVERMAWDMQMGFWSAPMPRHGIKIDQDLRLVDGLRRLMAICQAQVTVKMRVERVTLLDHQ